MILTVLGWIAAIGLLLACASSARHGIREKAAGPWAGAGLYACGAVILLAADGILKPLTAGVLAFLALALAAGLALRDGRKGAGKAALGHAGAGFGYLSGDARSLWQWLLAWIRRILHRGPAVEAGSPEAVVGEYANTRSIPPVREDPLLGLPPEPAALTSVAAPAPYAALAQFIGGFEPEDDQALKMFMEGNAAGSVIIADAWHAFADTCLNSAGLDPAYVAGILEAGDSAGEHGSLLAQVHKRFGVVYGAIQEWVAAGRMLPHKAREFLTGEM